MLWDICDVICGSYEKGWDDGRQDKHQEMSIAYIEKRLHKRTRRGSVYVEIKNRPVQPDADGVTRVSISVGGKIPGIPTVAR